MSEQDSTPKRIVIERVSVTTIRTKKHNERAFCRKCWHEVETSLEPVEVLDDATARSHAPELGVRK